MTSAKEPNFAINDLASDLTSRRGRTQTPAPLPDECRRNQQICNMIANARLAESGGAITGVVCPDHVNASNPKTLFIGANRPAS